MDDRALAGGQGRRRVQLALGTRGNLGGYAGGGPALQWQPGSTWWDELVTNSCTRECPHRQRLGMSSLWQHIVHMELLFWLERTDAHVGIAQSLELWAQLALGLAVLARGVAPMESQWF
jgi:hypothetical protein